MATEAAALNADLRHLEAAARGLLNHNLRATPENLAGYVEAAAVDDTGRVWLMGTLQRGLPAEANLIIADRRRHAGALAAVCFPRADLPADMQAFIGVVASGWRPGPGTADLYCFLGAGLDRFLRGIKPLQLVEARAIATQLARVRASCTAGRVEEICAMMAEATEWSPHSPRAGFAVKSSVDRVVVLPGFGAFVEGWVLSPSKPVVQFSLRLGSKVLHGVPGSLVRSARPDVASVAGHTPRLLERCGFAVVLTGPLAAEDLLDPVLKAHFDDGSTANLPVDPEIVWRLGHAVPIDEVLRLYPGLAEESFFPGFAVALRQDIAARLGEATSIATATPAARCVVLAVPALAADARLLVDELTQALRNQAEPPGVVLLADGGTSRAELPLLARSVTQASGRRCGITLVEQADKPLWALPAVLEQLGCDRFLFVAMNAFPDRTGWAAALAALAGADSAPHALQYGSPARLAALAWTRAGYLAWLREASPAPGPHTAGPALGQRHAEVLLPLATPLPGSALSVQPAQAAERILEAVDQMDESAA